MARKPIYVFSQNSKEIMVSYLNREMDIYRDLCPADLDENYVDGLLTAYERMLKFVKSTPDIG